MLSNVPDMDSVGNVSFVDDSLSAKQGKIAEKLNSVQHIVQISQLGNLAQYAPTDCPTREKHFWLGDALSIAEEAMLNYAVAPLFANFLHIIADEQGHGTKYPLDFPNVVPVVVASQIQQPSFKKLRRIIKRMVLTMFRGQLRFRYTGLDVETLW